MKKIALLALFLCVGSTVFGMRKRHYSPELLSVIKNKKLVPLKRPKSPNIKKSKSLGDIFTKKKSQEEFALYKKAIEELASPEKISDLREAYVVIPSGKRSTIVRFLKLTVIPKPIFFNSNVGEEIFLNSLSEVFRQAQECLERISDERKERLLPYTNIDFSSFLDNCPSDYTEDEYSECLKNVPNILGVIRRKFGSPDCVIVDGETLNGVGMASKALSKINIQKQKRKRKKKSKLAIHEQSQ